MAVAKQNSEKRNLRRRYTREQASDAAYALVTHARRLAMDKHGALKPGPERWSRILAEEWEETEDELQTLRTILELEDRGPDYDKLVYEAEERVLLECAQVAQVCVGVMELILRGMTK